MNFVKQTMQLSEKTKRFPALKTTGCPKKIMSHLCSYCGGAEFETLFEST